MSRQETRRDGLDPIPNKSKVNELRSENSYLYGGGGMTVGMSESEYRSYTSKLSAKRREVYKVDHHTTTYVVGK
jgi:hypothetical protein